MKLLRMWKNPFNISAEKALAAALVKELVQAISPELMRERRTALSVNRITRQLENGYRKAVEHRVAQRLGYFRKVALINMYRWELVQSNYPDDFVQTAVEGLVMALSKRS